MQSPITIAANIAGLVEHFAAEGLTTKDYLQAALKDPARSLPISRHNQRQYQGGCQAF